MGEHKENILELAQTWLEEGRGLAVATVVATWGSSPRPCGSQLLVDNNGEFFGSVSGGCVEGAVITEAQEVIKNNQASLMEFRVSNEMAWDVGLACGGTVEVYVEPIGADGA
jgi:xanthine/CO dehydrogenase XdhC/CoxF family maturation factor